MLRMVGSAGSTHLDFPRHCDATHACRRGDEAVVQGTAPGLRPNYTQVTMSRSFGQCRCRYRLGAKKREKRDDILNSNRSKKEGRKKKKKNIPRITVAAAVITVAATAITSQSPAHHRRDQPNGH